MISKALVLNLDFRPISVCSAERAFVLVYQYKAEILSENPHSFFHTVTDSFPKPSVIRLRRYINLPYKEVLLNRENVFRRDRFQCQYCGNGKELTLDHVMPRARGGASTWHNLVTACKMCNSRKGDSTPEEAGLKLLTPPFKPSYVHFLLDFSGETYREWVPFLQRDYRVA